MICPRGQVVRDVSGVAHVELSQSHREPALAEQFAPGLAESEPKADDGLRQCEPDIAVLSSLMPDNLKTPYGETPPRGRWPERPDGRPRAPFHGVAFAIAYPCAR